MAMDPQAQKCAELINSAKSIAALTGAGISTNAGIPDFRGPKGLYVTQKYDPDKVFDINYFKMDPEPFYEFARDFVGLEQDLQPTQAHRFLTELEKKGKLCGVVTQNIDSLHQRAGTQNVLEMHGSFMSSHCLDCKRAFSYTQMKAKLFSQVIARCSCSGVIKPDIVFFGENVKFLSEAYELAQKADLFFVIGTSCVVYPAAILPTLVQGKIIVVNLHKVLIPSVNIALSVEEDIDSFFKKVSQILNRGQRPKGAVP